MYERERINRLARGIVDGGVPGLMIKPERLEGSFGAGQTVKGEFLVQSTNDLYIKGLVYSSNERVRAVNEALEAFAAILYMRSTPAVWKMETKSRDLLPGHQWR